MARATSSVNWIATKDKTGQKARANLGFAAFLLSNFILLSHKSRSRTNRPWMPSTMRRDGKRNVVALEGDLHAGKITRALAQIRLSID